MAVNSFGLNAAVQAFPSAFEFGRSLVGQDNASLDRALKEKALAAQMENNFRQAEQEAEYKQGVLRNADYANRTQRIGVQDEARYRTGVLSNAEFENQTRRQAEEATARHYNRVDTIAEGDAPVQRGMHQAMTGYYGSMGRGQDAKTAEQNMVNDERKAEEEYGKAMLQLLDDPVNPGIKPELARRFMVEAGIMAHPNAFKAAQMFDAAQAELAKSGKTDMFNDELRNTVGSVLQPLIDQNTGAAPGSLRFAGFEPAEGGVRVKLQRVDPVSGQPVSQEPLYITNGRVPMAEGGVPTTFSVKDVHQVLGGLRAAANWQEANPEIAQEIRDMLTAHTGAHDSTTYAKNRALLSKARYAEIKDTAKRERLEQKDMARTRNALIKDAVSIADRLASFNEADFTVPNPDDPNAKGTRDVANIQRVNAVRQKVRDEITTRLKDANFEQLMGLTPDEIANSKTIYPLIQEFVNAARPAGSSQQPYVPPTSSGIQNSPAYGQPAGGRANPFSPTAAHGDESYGVLKTHLQSGKAENHLSGLHPAFQSRLAAMLQDAPQGVQIMSGWRSNERQAELWDAALHKYGSPEAARKWVAPPGHSNHNHGIASDLTFNSNAAKKWVHDNAARYGLRFRMAHEGWHIEPIEAHGDDANWGRQT